MRKKSPRGEARESSLASGWTVEPDATEPAAEDSPAERPPQADEGLAQPPQGSGADEADEAVVADGPREQLSNVALVLLGVLGGLYLLYTWVWISWAQYYSLISQATAAGSGSLGGVLQQTVFWAAPAAPALWFLCSVIIAGRRTGRLAISLLVGAVILVPVPMLIGSGAAL